MAGMRILVVEDTADVGEAIVASLKRMGHAVDWQTTGRIASLMGTIKIGHSGTQNHRFTQAEFRTFLFPAAVSLVAAGSAHGDIEHGVKGLRHGAAAMEVPGAWARGGVHGPAAGCIRGPIGELDRGHAGLLR